MNQTRDDFTADALAALAKLHDHDKEQIPLMLKFGEALAKARKGLKHGQFSNWCRDALKRSPSWCSSHRRLYEDHADLEPALAWARRRTTLGNCRSVERLLKIVADWRKANGRWRNGAEDAAEKADGRRPCGTGGNRCRAERDSR